MDHPATTIEEYIAARESRDPEFKAARERTRPAFEFRRALIGARIQAGLTQAQLAQRLGTSQAAVARMEAGAVKPSLTTIMKLADTLHVRFEISAENGLALAG